MATTYTVHVNPHSIWTNYADESEDNPNLWLEGNNGRITTLPVVAGQKLAFHINTFGSHNNQYKVRLTSFLTARVPYTFQNGEISGDASSATFEVSGASQILETSGESSGNRMSPVLWHEAKDHDGRKYVVVQTKESLDVNMQEQFFLAILICRSDGSCISVVLDPVIQTNTTPPGGG